jgi:hypothetical protein
MISTRFAPVVIVLLALALVPTIIHSYGSADVTDGLTAAAIPFELAGESGTATKRRPEWVMDRLESRDWIERNYSANLRLFVARSLDAKRLYHHPELAVVYPESFGYAVGARLPQRPDVPVFVLTGQDANSNSRALYVLLYDGHYVADPIRFQIRTSFELLFGRRKPMTLFFVRERDVPRDTPIEKTHAARLLFAALDSFQTQRPSAAP